MKFKQYFNISRLYGLNKPQIVISTSIDKKMVAKLNYRLTVKNTNLKNKNRIS